MSDEQYRFRFEAKKPKKKRLGKLGDLPKPEPPEPSCVPEPVAMPSKSEPRRKIVDWVRGRAVPYVTSLPARSADKAVIDAGSWLIILAVCAVLAFAGIQTGVITWGSASPKQELPKPGKKNPWEPEIKKH